tara:strand:- start:1107 stop:1367 length:261 start_codon:yes stop_codon:yes gene_type:complete
MEEQNIKSNRAGRPRISDADKLQRLEETRIKNKETQRLLRENNPEKCREYRVRYYHKHKEDKLKLKTEMTQIYNLYKEGKLIELKV